jgi:cell division transport system ATP-binding protein
MIQLIQVSKNYSSRHSALTDINLKIEKGEFVFIYGPSGAGKTTLLKLIFGMESPTKGEVIVNGVNLRKIKKSYLPGLRRKMGFVFQDFRLLNYRTAFDNVALALEVTGTKPKEIKRKVQQVLKHVGLLSRMNILPPALSGGEQQRVAIARAIVNEPLLLLADEPTGNLDAELTKEIIKLFKIINAWGTTIVIATHDQNLLNFTPTKVVALERGKIKGVLLPRKNPGEDFISANTPLQS